MPQFTVHGRFTFDGHAVVEAKDVEDAKAKFDSGEFEVDTPTAAIVDWERYGKPEAH